MSEDFTLSQKERDALMEQVYGGYVRNPATVSGNKATQGDRAPHRHAGKIDYGAYGGSASDDFMDKRYENYRNSKYYDPDRKTTFKDDGYGERWRNRETWNKVAGHLGIDKVDDEGDLRKMYDFVKGYEAKSEKDDDTEEPLDPNTERPDQVTNAQNLFNDTKLDRPENQQPRLEDAMMEAGSGNMGAVRGGDDLNEWYQTKFVPHLEADANATNSEQGDDSRYFLDKFAFDPPKLGDVKDIFDKYKGEIEGLD